MGDRLDRSDRAIRHFADDPAFDLIGVFVTSDAKHGKDVGDLARIRRLGIAATTSIVDLLAIEADAVNYAPLYARRSLTQRMSRPWRTPAAEGDRRSMAPESTRAFPEICSRVHRRAHVRGSRRPCFAWHRTRSGSPLGNK